MGTPAMKTTLMARWPTTSLGRILVDLMDTRRFNDSARGSCLAAWRP